MLKRPTKKSIKPAIWGATGAILGLLLVAWFLPGGLELRITLVLKGKPLLVLPLKPGERFTVHYNHSVEKAPIWEEHSVDKEGRIYIEEERYLKFGAGMGRMPGVGRMVKRGPYEVIENMHMPTGNFIMRVGSPGVDHTIIWRGIRKNLSAVAPHQAVRFSAQPVSLLYILYRSISAHGATPIANCSDCLINPQTFEPRLSGHAQSKSFTYGCFLNS